MITFARRPVWCTPAVILLGMALCAPTAQAVEPVGLAFSHKDWELACDNTRTCRAAGYQGEDDELPVSVLFTRRAGPNQPVTGKVQLGDDDGDNYSDKLTLTLRINKREIGKLAVDMKSRTADLNNDLVNALLVALTGTSRIEWTAGKNTWRLSDQGAVAILLKMDEFQGRLGTIAALAKKGQKGEENVLQPIPAPVIQVPALDKPRPGDQMLAKRPQVASLRKALRATLKGADSCDLFDKDEPELRIDRLTGGKLLVSTECWLAAYNAGSAFWVINDKPPFNPVLVTTLGSDFNKGEISSSQKGRGLGDCWSTDTWAWDGRQFVHSASGSTGLCKMIAAGGAWQLPTLVMDVRQAP